MNSIPGYIVVPFLGFLFFTFPGILFIKNLPGFSTLLKITAAIFISLGFWICISWFISWLALPLDLSAFFLQFLFIVYFFAKYTTKIKEIVSKISIPGIKKIPLHYFVLALALLLLGFPILFITIPPGCDTSMHGYITRLIIDNNGLPHSYRPILPVNYFGSYSAGYHIVTALVCGVNTVYLRHAINFISIIVYPLTLLALIFSLKNFFSERTAIYTSIIFFGINRTYIGTIWWGGNPSMLSFAFCLFSFGLLMYAVQNRYSKALYFSAFTIAAIPLVHAIPAITFVYVSFVGYVILIYQYKAHFKWIVLNTVLLIICVLFLLLPFLIHFKNENSPELLLMIKNWQNEMMGKKLTNTLSGNLFVVADQIKYRIGDVLTILSGISLAFLFYFKKYKQIIYSSILILFIYLLVLNCAYWFLPFSELLYPERVVYFIIICWALIFGYFLTELENRIDKWSIFNKKLSVYFLIVSIMLCISAQSIIDQSIGLSSETQVSCDKPTVAAFDWINANTEKDALFVASYADAGMWIPTFTNRATLGTHMHFIHEVQHIPDTLNASAAPRYFFITKRDMEMKNEMMGMINNRVKLFSNSEIEIYH